MIDDENKPINIENSDLIASSEHSVDIPVAENVSASKIVASAKKTIDDEDIDFDDDLDASIVVASVAKKSKFTSFLTDKITLIAIGSFATMGAAVGGYLYYTTMQNQILANPGVVQIKRPPVNIAQGTVGVGQSPLEVMKKQGQIGGSGSEMVSANIVDEILNIDDSKIAEEGVDLKQSILTEVIPQDKAAREKQLELEKEQRLAKARELMEQNRLKLQEEEIEALAYEMAKADAEVVADTDILEELLREDAVLEAAFDEERKAKEEAAKAEAEAKKLAEAKKIVEELAKREAEERKVAEAKKLAEQAQADAVEKKEGDTVLIDGAGEKVLAEKKVEPLEPSKIDLAAVADAELAIIQNAVILDTLPPPSQIALDPNEKIIPDALKSMQGRTVGDILSQQANVRPLPQQYVVVQKEREAEDIRSQMTSALSALGQGRYVAALELFNNMYRDNPDNAQVLMGRAVAMQKLGQNAGALIAYEEVLRVDPRNLEALTNMLGLLKEQDNQTALFNLNQLRELYPYNADITAQLGMVYGMVSDYENAVKYLDMADALKPNDMNILYNKAIAYDKMGKSRQAADIYRKIVYRASLGEISQSFPIDAVKRRLASIR